MSDPIKDDPSKNEPASAGLAKGGTDGDGPRARLRRFRGAPLIRTTWVYVSLVTLFDALVCGLAVMGAVRWRYDFLNVPLPGGLAETSGMIAAALCVPVWLFLGVGRGVWRYTSLDDIAKIAQAVFVVMAVLPFVVYAFAADGERFPASTPLIAGPLAFLVLVIARLSVLVVRNGDIRAAFNKRSRARRDALLVGSGQALHNALRDMGRGRAGPGVNVVGLVNTDGDDAGRSIRGYPVVASLSTLSERYGAVRRSRAARRRDEPLGIVAVDPRLRKAKASALLRTAAALGAPVTRLRPDAPGELTPFEAQDLIGRSPRQLDITPVRRLVENRRVLVTGAGGSIGSEIVRQVAALAPAHLCLLDHGEFNLYQIDRELREGPFADTLHWRARLGDVCDAERMEAVFAEARPDLVLHAAALKHVPMGEANPLQTLRTNVLGTHTLLEASARHGTAHFTLVSTDKAVEPSNIMGLSKFVAERLVRLFDQTHPGLEACAVRFGNVLASTGSVVPLFEAQIARGGPVTVTHPRATRYFMTTEEASSLVLQATALNASQRDPGEGDPGVFVLEMGAPVGIAALARQLINLRGLVPDKDIEIHYTGLRPGETLHEALTTPDETLESTYVEGVLRVRSDAGEGLQPRSATQSATQSVTQGTRGEGVEARRLLKLVEALAARDREGVRRVLVRLVPGADLSALERGADGAPVREATNVIEVRPGGD